MSTGSGARRQAAGERARARHPGRDEGPGAGTAAPRAWSGEGARARSRCRPEGEEESEAQDEALDPLGTERQEGLSDRKTKQWRKQGPEHPRADDKVPTLKGCVMCQWELRESPHSHTSPRNQERTNLESRAERSQGDQAPLPPLRRPVQATSCLTTPPAGRCGFGTKDTLCCKVF